MKCLYRNTMILSLGVINCFGGKKSSTYVTRSRLDNILFLQQITTNCLDNNSSYAGRSRPPYCMSVLWLQFWYKLQPRIEHRINLFILVYNKCRLENLTTNFCSKWRNLFWLNSVDVLNSEYCFIKSEYSQILTFHSFHSFLRIIIYSTFETQWIWNNCTVCCINGLWIEGFLIFIDLTRQ